MRVALHSVLDPGTEDDYVREHRRIPDALVDVFAAAGISDWTIWRSGDRLFHLVECEDFEYAMSIVEHHPANIGWQNTIGRFVAEFRTAEGDTGFRPLAEVWRLSRQEAD